MELVLAIIRPLIHYGLHFVFPGLISWIFFKKKHKRTWLILVATMLVDLDHLFAWPDLFVVDRCSIGFHPLHSYIAITFYFLMTFIPKVRIIGLGLLLHMATDWLDCFWIK